jgi:anti-sigma factor RsiW
LQITAFAELRASRDPICSSFHPQPDSVVSDARYKRHFATGQAPRGVCCAERTAPGFQARATVFLKAALKFGFIFLALSTAGLLAQRSLGVFGFYAVSVAGGLLSSASAVAAAGIAPTHHQIQFQVAANGAVLASLTSALINIPLIVRSGGQPRLTKAIARALLIVIALGVIALLVRKPLEVALRPALLFRKAATVSPNSLGTPRFNEPVETGTLQLESSGFS